MGKFVCEYEKIIDDKIFFKWKELGKHEDLEDREGFYRGYVFIEGIHPAFRNPITDHEIKISDAVILWQIEDIYETAKQEKEKLINKIFEELFQEEQTLKISLVQDNGYLYYTPFGNNINLYNEDLSIYFSNEYLIERMFKFIKNNFEYFKPKSKEYAEIIFSSIMAMGENNYLSRLRKAFMNYINFMLLYQDTFKLKFPSNENSISKLFKTASNIKIENYKMPFIDLYKNVVSSFTIDIFEILDKYFQVLNRIVDTLLYSEPVFKETKSNIHSSVVQIIENGSVWNFACKNLKTFGYIILPIKDDNYKNGGIVKHIKNTQYALYDLDQNGNWILRKTITDKELFYFQYLYILSPIPIYCRIQ